MPDFGVIVKSKLKSNVEKLERARTTATKQRKLEKRLGSPNSF